MNSRVERDGPRVAFWPRWPDNPYLVDLRSGLQSEGASTFDASVGAILRGVDVLHIQWPDAIWSGSPAGRLVRLGDVVVLLILAAARRARLVVTVHNLIGHESAGPVSRFIVGRLIRYADRIVVLSSSGKRRLLEAAQQSLEADRVVVIPIMDWAERYASLTRDEAAEYLDGLPSGSGPLLGWFGLIRPYKGVGHLVSVVEQDDVEPPLRLMLLGRRHVESGAEEWVQVAAECERVVHVDRHVTDDEIRALCAFADAMVFPFSRIENSASVVAALAAGASVIAPRIGALVDLEPHPRLHLYDGAFTRATLDGIEARDALRPNAAEDRSVAEVARRHLALYSAVSA